MPEWVAEVSRPHVRGTILERRPYHFSKFSVIQSENLQRRLKLFVAADLPAIELSLQGAEERGLGVSSVADR